MLYVRNRRRRYSYNISRGLQFIEYEFVNLDAENVDKLCEPIHSGNFQKCKTEIVEHQCCYPWAITPGIPWHLTHIAL